jgi:hypothetical protein
MGRMHRLCWDEIINNAVNAMNSVEDFDKCLKEFFSCYASEQDQALLLQQLRNPEKKRKDIPLMLFMARVRELNRYVCWLPGDRKPLTGEEIKGTLYKAMPTLWQVRFDNNGKTIHDVTETELQSYFRIQEASDKYHEQYNQQRQLVRAQCKSKGHKKTPTKAKKTVAKPTR